MDADPITSGLTGETFTTSGDPIVDAAPHYWSEGKAIHAQLTVIQKLHKADEECTLAQDPALWSYDGINLGFPGPPVVEIKAIGEAYAKFRGHPATKIRKLRS